MSPVAELSRRGFLEGLVSTGAFVIGCRLVPGAAVELFAEGADAPWEPSVYLAIEPDGLVRIVAHRSEMGTGIRTVLPTVVAEELDADWARVSIVQALGDKKYGSQNTDGSCSIRDFYEAMRVAGATARTMLERAAAAQWGVPAGECRARNHAVVHAPSNRQAPFGTLVAAASKLPVPAADTLTFKPAADYRYVGKDFPIVDLADLCNGRGTFGMDLKVPGMVYASIERPPVLGATLKGHDASEALKVPGVTRVVVLDAKWDYPVLMKPQNGVAVIATNTWAAMRGRQRLKTEWDPGPHGGFSTAAEKTEMLQAAQRPQKVMRNGGDVEAAFAAASRVVESSYYTPMLAHAPMEPPVAVASFTDGKVEVWAPTQNPQAVQEVVALALGVQETDVTCHVSLLGGGFGRKSFPDYCAEAALLSRQLGMPVKVVWSRPEDIQSDFFHAASAMHMKAGLDAAGRPTAWLQRSVMPPIFSIFKTEEEYAGFQLSMGFTDLPFDVPNVRVENGPAKAHTRIGWLRSVSNIPHAFAVQSFVDELAHAAGRDPIEYSLEALGKDRLLDFTSQGVAFEGPEATPAFAPDTARLRRVIEIVRERSGWTSRTTTRNRGWGFAAHRSFLSYIAVVAEVEIDDDGAVHVARIDLAADCGRVVSPDRVRAQFEGAAVFGTSVALFGAITAEGGRIQQSNFNDYRVARFAEAPRQTHVHLVPSDAAPSGVGEPGVPPIAPAIGNAIFAARGTRVRELPIGARLA